MAGAASGNKERFAATLKAAMSARSMGATELATQVGVSRQTVYAWTRGLAWPDSDALLALGRLLNIRVDDLAGSGPAPAPTSAFVMNFGSQIEAFIEAEIERRVAERLAELGVTQPTRAQQSLARLKQSEAQAIAARETDLASEHQALEDADDQQLPQLAGPRARRSRG